MIIDTHCHIYLCKKNTEENIMSDLKEISKMISIGIDLETSLKSIFLAKKYQGIIYATIGIHPCHIIDYKDENIDDIFQKLEKIYLENKKYVKGIGECGYDFYHIPEGYTKNEIHKLQTIFFEKHIDLAKKYCLPIIIHTRNAKEETYEILKKTGFKKFIIHCFSEDLDFANKCIKLSNECKISFSGIVTYKSALNVQEVASKIDISKILVETDSPYLAPQEVRGTENIPQNTVYNLKKVYYLQKNNGLNLTFEDFKKVVYDNSLDIFDLK